MENKKDYKSTLNMPFTEFSMKADLNIKELKFRKLWLDKNIYEQVLKKNQNKPLFILHDGPPYANGPVHCGHALNKILKDIIVRYKSINNFYSPYVPGWDTHGLPIENKMLSEMKLSHKSIKTIEIRRKAAKYALEQIENQKEQMKKFQLLTDFKQIYKTLDKNYEVAQLKIFKKMCLDGLIYRGLKPVYWSPSSQSALAEAEVEYIEHRSPSVFVKLPIIDGNKYVSKGDYLLIWTTTPWTLIANSGVAINSNIQYSLVKYENTNFIIAADLIEKLSLSFNWENKYEVLKTFKGSDILGIKYKSVINNLNCPVVEGHHVTLEAGSGLVHIAPLFGEDDFLIGKKNDLNQIMHINDDGTINEHGNEYKGIFYEDANKNIGQWLEQNNYLVQLKFIKHQYPHDWRTKKPIIFRGTPQWFVSISKIKNEIQKELKKVNFYSEWGYKRISKMIENRDDWTISRQRAWGVPIIIFYDENNVPVMNEEIFDYVINLVSKHGTNVWYESSVNELLPEKFRNKNWTKENDIMDVWFDSGVSFEAVKIDDLKPPFDLYLEGNDQYRGWFNSSLINSVAFNGCSPYKSLISHGFVVDEKGRKMSKSLGNGVDPIEIINQLGADILRLWVANSEYSNDVSISKNIISQTTEIYRKLRNTIRFMLSNLYDYKHTSIELTGINLLIMERLENLKNKVKKNYDKYQFMSVVKDINNFVTELSGFYLSIMKDILYVEKPDSKLRREVQYVIHECLYFLLISLYPIIPTTCEEAYQLFDKNNKKDSICLEDFYQIKNETEVEENKWKEFFDLKNEIYKMIEELIQKGQIKRSNEAFVIISTDSNFIKSLDLKMLLMVGNVQFGTKTEVKKFESEKCLRCWNHFDKEEIKENLCKRCFDIINN